MRHFRFQSKAMKIPSLLLLLTITAFQAYGDLPKVVVLGTGGTIQSKGDTRMTLHDYRAGRFDISELLEALPEANSIANIEAMQFSNVGSPAITSKEWIGLSKKIDEMAAKDPEIAGFVITHGTNTLEETAYFLHLTVKTDRPVVMVGAQRPGTAISGDGPMNLYHAIQVAALPDARAKGVLVCMNQQINSAREVTKTSTYKVEAFNSRDLGLLGVVDPDLIRLARKPTRRHTFLSEFHIGDFSDMPRVDILDTYIEAPGDLVDFLVEKGTKGIVFSGHGAGGLSPAQTEAAKKAVEKGVVVVTTSRTGSGRVIPTSRSIESGIVTGDNLLPHKARILLQVALASGKSTEEMKRIFDTY